jgi:trk system potassium uptake protein TrkA
MKTVIIGAGEFGRGLASVLCGEGHEVVVVDNSSKLLKRLSENLDIMTVQGNGLSGSVLRQVLSSGADLLVAATGEDTANILACQLGANLGVRETICRLSSEEYFDATPDFLPALFGINRIIVPSLECAEKIINVVGHRAVLEKIIFKDIGVEITSFRLETTSPLIGVRLRDFPDRSLLSKIRFSGIIRRGKFMIPRGETTFAADDEVFVSGLSESVIELIEWASGEKSAESGERVIIGGASAIGKRLAVELLSSGYDVRIVEESRDKCEKILESLGKNLMVLNGDPTDHEILDEAGINGAIVYISAMEDDENNVMSCMLAKKRGVKKAITIVNKSDYSALFSSLEMIDCFFSPSVVGVNSALKFLEEEKSRVIALVHRANAFVFELKVEKKSPVCGMRIADCGNLPEMVFAFVCRNGVMMPAVGELCLEEGDRVATISDFDTMKKLEPYFYFERGVTL